MTKTRKLVLKHLNTYGSEIIGYAREMLNKNNGELSDIPTVELVEILLQIETEPGSPKF